MRRPTWPPTGETAHEIAAPTLGYGPHHAAARERGADGTANGSTETGRRAETTRPSAVAATSALTILAFSWKSVCTSLPSLLLIRLLLLLATFAHPLSVLSRNALLDPLGQEPQGFFLSEASVRTASR